MFKRALAVGLLAATAITVIAPMTTASATSHATVVAKKKPKPGTGPIPYTPPTPPAPIAYKPGQLVFAQFNVCKTQCDAPAPSWDIRRTRAQAVLAATTADVIGVNEATNYSTSTAKTQWEDIQNLMAPYGYSAIKATVDECERPRDANGQLAGPSPCEHTTGILYKTATVHEYTPGTGTPSSGAVMLRTINPAADADSGAREVNWALMQANDGSTPPFLAISLHMSTIKDDAHEATRVGTAQALAGWANSKIAAAGLPASTPIVLMADLNSYAKRQPNGAQKVLTDNGWTDAYSAPTIVNERWSSINETPVSVPWSGKVYFYYSRKNPVTRIDYIMSRGATPLMYETLMWLNPDRTRTEAYAASDHNAIRAVLKF